MAKFTAKAGKFLYFIVEISPSPKIEISNSIGDSSSLKS